MSALLSREKALLLPLPPLHLLDVAAAAAALSAFAAVDAPVVPASFDVVASTVVAAAAEGDFFCLSAGLAHVHALFIFRALFAMLPLSSVCCRGNCC